MVAVVGFPGYEIKFDEETGQPRVWSNFHHNGTEGRFLKPDIVMGYQQFRLKNADGKFVRIKIHRLVALTLIPNPENHPTVDHLNCNKLDNRVENLRWANRTTQQRNRSSSKGYSWNKAASKWVASISIDRRHKYLGSFDTEAEARSAYVGAHNLLFGDICMKE